MFFVVLKKLGERIRLLRKELNLTQEEFGEKIGVKGNTVTGYERGSRSPSDSIINYICLIFNVNQTWLRTGEGDMFLEGYDFGDALSNLWAKYDCNNIEMDFLKSYFSLKKSDRNAFCKILHKMFPQSIPEPQDTEPWKNSDLYFQEWDYQEAPSLDTTPSSVAEIVAELKTLKKENQELRTRLEAVEKEEEIVKGESLPKVSKKSGF